MGTYLIINNSTFLERLQESGIISLIAEKGVIMKRTILAISMAIVIATPCFAQEIESDGLFSIEGTEWMRIGVAIQILEPPFISLYHDTVRFTDLSGIIYQDFLVFSVVSEMRYSFMVLQPAIGIGFYGQLIWIAMPSRGSSALFNGPVPPIRFGLNFGFMFKIDDNLLPPEEPDVE